MQIKASELSGAALHWAVAIALGWKWRVNSDGKITLARPAKRPSTREACDVLGLDYFHPTKCWSIAGPIIEREGINLDNYAKNPQWSAWTPAPERKSGEAQAYGPTPLIAAMRCYVASKLGDDVNIPEELCAVSSS